MGALVVGGIGFSGGFFGPMILVPGANQGPLLGLLITGPVGFLVGAVGGCFTGSSEAEGLQEPPADMIRPTTRHELVGGSVRRTEAKVNSETQRQQM